MIKKLKENKNGFTLVELIVVLVIIAILAAMLIPALTGYINRAKNKSIVAETRSVVMAAQTLADEAYAKADVSGNVSFDKTNTATTGTTYASVANLAEVAVTNIDTIVVGTGDRAGVITEVIYKTGGKTCTYTAGDTNGTDGAYNVE